VTPRLLLSHQSGLRNGDDYPVRFGDNLVERLAAARGEPRYGGWYAPPGEAPGRYFAYADVNTTVIAAIMETITGQRFDLHMREILFAPHELDIGYNWSGVSQKKRDRAAPAARNFDGVWTVQVEDCAAARAGARQSRAPRGHAFVRRVQTRRKRLCLRPAWRLAAQRERYGQARASWPATRRHGRSQWSSDGTNGATEAAYAAYGLCMQRPGSARSTGFSAPTRRLARSPRRRLWLDDLAFLERARWPQHRLHAQRHGN
jgi:CubicO group peptidase (beta-lactamase class C family)